MSFLEDLKRAIKKNESIPLLLDGCMHTPKAHQNPLVTSAIALFGEERCEALISEAIKDNLFNGIRKNQDALMLLNSTEGRKYLHRNLDSLLDYLTSEKFSKKYKCPSCHAVFSGKRVICSSCGVALKWK